METSSTYVGIQFNWSVVFILILRLFLEHLFLCLSLIGIFVGFMLHMLLRTIHFSSLSLSFFLCLSLSCGRFHEIRIHISKSLPTKKHTFECWLMYQLSNVNFFQIFFFSLNTTIWIETTDRRFNGREHFYHRQNLLKENRFSICTICSCEKIYVDIVVWMRECSLELVCVCMCVCV